MNLDDLILKAKNKDEDAMYLLSLLYLRGERGVQKDLKKAYQLLEDSAGLGKVDALYQLAKIHMTSEYERKDTQKAIKLLSQCSKKGHTKSSFELGLIYYKGLDGKVDIEKAEEYFRPAAINSKKPIVEAQLLMANIYENGLLLNHVDSKEAYRFYLLAAKKENSLAQFKVGEFLIKGIPDELEQNVEEGIKYLNKASLAGEKAASLLLAKFFLESAKNLLSDVSKENNEVKYILEPLSEINIDLL